MKKLIIFDYDGTLADTSPGIQYCYNTTAMGMGFSPHTNRQDFQGVIGGPLEKGFKRLWPQMTEKLVPKAVLQYRQIYADEGIRMPAPLYEDMKNTLLTLKKTGIYLAIATLKHERFIQKMLIMNEIEELFDAVCAYRNGEEKRDLLLKACALVKVCPKDCLLVGDSAYDGQGAQSVSMEFAAALYGWGFQTEEEASPYSPCFCLKRPAELLDYLRLKHKIANKTIR